MSKFWFRAIFLLLFPIAVFAQTFLIVHKNDGSVHYVPVNGVDRVTFTDTPPPNDPPAVTNIQHEGGATQDIIISYDLSDQEGDISSIFVEYTGGSSGTGWTPASVSGATTGLAPGTYLRIIWHSAVDELGENATNYMVRITPNDGVDGTSDTTSSFSVNNSTPLGNAPPIVLNVQTAGDTQDIVISYDLFDTEDDDSSMTVEYIGGSAGSTWATATVTGATTGLGPGTDLTITWNSDVDEPGTIANDYRIRLTPNDGAVGTPGVSSAFTVSNLVPYRYALVVGIDQYSLGSATNTSGINDANTFENFLLDDVARWEPARVTKLLDSTATKAAIRNQLFIYALLSQPGDLVVYYHSGLGDQQVMGTQQAYMLAYDDYYQDYELAQDLQLFKAGVTVIVIAETSFAEGLFDGLTIPADLAWIAATPWDETNVTGSPFSLFSGHLLDGFRFGDSNTDGDVSFMELYNYVNSIAEPLLHEQKFGDSILTATIAAAVRVNHAPVVSDVQISGSTANIAVSFDLADAEFDTCDITVEYWGGSAGSTWSTASVSGSTTALTPAQDLDITWLSDVDEPGTIASDLQIRITPSDGTVGTVGYSNNFSINNNTPPVASNVQTAGAAESIVVTYDLDDVEDDLIDIDVEYMGGNAGSTWETASVSGTVTGLKMGTGLTFNWNSHLDEAQMIASNYQIKITPTDYGVGTPGISSEFYVSNNGLPEVSSVTITGDSGIIEVDYDLTDREGNICSIHVDYVGGSAGSTWQSASVSGEHLIVSPNSGVHTLYWHSEADEAGQDADDYIIRLTPYDVQTGIAGQSMPFPVNNVP